MKNILILLTFLSTTPAFAGVATTTCASADGSVRVTQREGGPGIFREVTINGESIQALGFTETIEQVTELERSGNPASRMSIESVVKASYRNPAGAVVLSKWLVCHFSYGF
jgi:hypothetical protein